MGYLSILYNFESIFSTKARHPENIWIALFLTNILDIPQGQTMYAFIVLSNCLKSN